MTKAETGPSVMSKRLQKDDTRKSPEPQTQSQPQPQAQTQAAAS
jgi:hypothetical protein